MKNRSLQRSLIALLIPLLYFISISGINYVSKESFIQASLGTLTNAKDFLNVIFNVTYGGVPDQNWVERNLNMYRDSLNYNAIQIYDEGSDRFGTFDDPLTSNQIQNVINLMTDIENRDLKGFYARTKIFRLAEGQRLEYEVSQSGSTTVNDGFCYQNVMNNTFTTDTGRTVLHAKTWPADYPDSPGWLCYGIYENMQHSDYINGKDKGNWFLKPMMRINQNDFDSTSATPVVAIVIKNFDGSRTDRDSIVIRVNNFRNENNRYFGNYIEKYNFAFGIDSLQKIGDTSSFGINHGNNGNLESSQIDFKVYWFGLVDVWFDKMTVDDEIGDKLFKGERDERIQDEVSHFTDEQSNYTFYCDEAVFSQIPCLEYVKNKMLDYNPDSRISFVMSDGQNRYSLRNDEVAYGSVLSRVNPKIFFTDPYLIPWEIPDNLNFPGAQQISSSAYNDTLQRVLGDKNSTLNIYENSFIKQVNLARTKMNSNSPGSKFFVIPQLFGHMRKSNSTGNFLKYGNREPTNEELQTQAMISIAHGAEGLGWYVYQNTEWQGDNFSGNPATGGHSFLNNNVSALPYNYTYFNFGLWNLDSTKRTSNIFGQNKWDYVSIVNRKILIWKPELDKINWQAGNSVHTEGADNEFISDIKSIKRNPSFGYTDDPPCTYCDETNERYWEMGFFTPDSLNDRSKYFIMVNRRCVPDTPNYGQGDLRQLNIKFNSTQLTSFRNWKITDINTNSLIRTFDKDSNVYVNMGEFNPGEGKLYKLSPVMQEGGTLVADESVSNVQFVCKSTVMNNGKNITIGSGTEIFFREGAGINMTGGNFICDGSQGNDNILLKGNNAEHWNGINLINTGSSTKIEKTTFENTKSPVIIDNSQFGSQYAQKIIRRNIFYITHDSGIALRIRNQFAMLIDSNTFDVSNFNSTSGIYYSNYSDPGPAGGTPEDNYFVNITNNIFSGAYFPVLINDLGTAYSSFYMYNNQFQNTQLFGISGMKITGTIKNNRFLNSTENFCIYLSLSNPDIYGNYFNSDKRNMVLTASYPDIAPLRNNNNQLIWKGGRNGFNVNQGNDTIAKENILLKSSLPITDLGENSFSVPNSSSYHIFGSISSDDSSQAYLTTRNCWIGNNDIPKIFIYNPLDTPVMQIGYIFNPVICIPSENTSNEITEIGFGMYDTTFISEYDSTDMLPEDEALYSEAREMLSNGNNAEAITNFKALIDEFHTNDYIYSSEDYLYESYRGLDTSEDQEVTDILFSDLKQYLETKISVGHYDEDFDDNAYEIILMCEQKLENYNSALSGYEFISLYHPDAYRRIQASWEYDNIESILSGMGGGERDLEFGNSNLEFDMSKRLKRINEFADNDPATGKIRQNYLKANSEKKANEQKKANRDFKESKTTNILNPGRSNDNDDKLIERAKQNLFLSKRISKEEKERRRFEDMKLILNPDNLQAGQKETDNLIPVQYSLSQNYPNPFNPNTKFKFSLPAESRVSITVYDLLGREVEKLINNEFRKAGVYTVEFAAKNLSSGVYFYRLEAGNFIQTKRMILLK